LLRRLWRAPRTLGVPDVLAVLDAPRVPLRVPHAPDAPRELLPPREPHAPDEPRDRHPPREPHDFRPLRAMTSHWAAETLSARSRWPDAGLVQEGLDLLESLSKPSADDVLLATDLHAGNVLAAEREPWLVIDPKPFIGDRAYDLTQHLLNCKERLSSDPEATIRRLSDLAELDAERVRLWLFARSASEPRDDWDAESQRLARVLSLLRPLR
jgi:streptomycin 6-kinase